MFVLKENVRNDLRKEKIKVFTCLKITSPEYQDLIGNNYYKLTIVCGDKSIQQ